VNSLSEPTSGLNEELLADGSVNVANLNKEFGITRSRAYEMMNAGILPFVQLGRKRLIPRRAVMRLLAANLKGTNQ
jgi:excisionase family DNA binding protein